MSDDRLTPPEVVADEVALAAAVKAGPTAFLEKRPPTWRDREG